MADEQSESSGVSGIDEELRQLLQKADEAIAKSKSLLPTKENAQSDPEDKIRSLSVAKLVSLFNKKEPQKTENVDVAMETAKATNMPAIDRSETKSEFNERLQAYLEDQNKQAEIEKKVARPEELQAVMPRMEMIHAEIDIKIPKTESELKASLGKKKVAGSVEGKSESLSLEGVSGSDEITESAEIDEIDDEVKLFDEDGKPLDWIEEASNASKDSAAARKQKVAKPDDKKPEIPFPDPTYTFKPERASKKLYAPKRNFAEHSYHKIYIPGKKDEPIPYRGGARVNLQGLVSPAGQELERLIETDKKLLKRGELAKGVRGSDNEESEKSAGIDSLEDDIEHPEQEENPDSASIDEIGSKDKFVDKEGSDQSAQKTSEALTEESTGKEEGFLETLKDMFGFSGASDEVPSDSEERPPEEEESELAKTKVSENVELSEPYSPTTEILTEEADVPDLNESKSVKSADHVGSDEIEDSDMLTAHGSEVSEKAGKSENEIDADAAASTIYENEKDTTAYETGIDTSETEMFDTVEKEDDVQTNTASVGRSEPIIEKVPSDKSDVEKETTAEQGDIDQADANIAIDEKIGETMTDKMGDTTSVEQPTESSDTIKKGDGPSKDMSDIQLEPPEEPEAEEESKGFIDTLKGMFSFSGGSDEVSEELDGEVSKLPETEVSMDASEASQPARTEQGSASVSKQASISEHKESTAQVPKMGDFKVRSVSAESPSVQRSSLASDNEIKEADNALERLMVLAAKVSEAQVNQKLKELELLSDVINTLPKAVDAHPSDIRSLISNRLELSRERLTIIWIKTKGLVALERLLQMEQGSSSSLTTSIGTSAYLQSMQRSAKIAETLSNKINDIGKKLVHS